MSDDRDELTPELERARDTFQNVMMAHGLGGTIWDWLDITAAIDAYTEAVVQYARNSPDSRTSGHAESPIP